MADHEQQKTLIGEFTIALSQLDVAMLYLFNTALGAGLPVAQAIYQSQEHVGARRDIVIAAVEKSTVLSEEARARARKMLQIHSSLFGIRNRYMHNTWTFDSDAGAFRMMNDRLMHQIASGKGRPVDAEEIMPIVKPSTLERDIAQSRKLFSDMLDLAIAEGPKPPASQETPQQ